MNKLKRDNFYLQSHIMKSLVCVYLDTNIDVWEGLLLLFHGIIFHKNVSLLSED